MERHLTLVDGTSDKFWTIVCDGTSVTVHYGRTGTKGQTRSWTYETAESALQDAQKLLAEKLKKGYTDLASASQDFDGTTYFEGAVRDLVRPGFLTLAQALEALLEQAEDDPEIPLTPDEAVAVVRQEWDRRAAELADGVPGDEVAVEAGFRALRDAGYVAEMNVGFTTSDAWPELGERTKASRAQGLAYFHGQDTARLAESPADLFIGFDCVSGDDADLVAVAQAIADAMSAQGLRVVWNGSARTRVMVEGITWRRPLPGTRAVRAAAPAAPPPPAKKKGLLGRFKT